MENEEESFKETLKQNLDLTKELKTALSSVKLMRFFAMYSMIVMSLILLRFFGVI